MPAIGWSWPRLWCNSAEQAASKPYCRHRCILNRRRVDRIRIIQGNAPTSGSNSMEILLALAIYFAIWVVVISGSIYFNKNVK